MFKLAADSLDPFNSFPAVVPDFDLNPSTRLVVSDCQPPFSVAASSEDQPRIIVIIHCHYPATLQFFNSFLDHIPNYDLIISITSLDLEESVSEWACTLKPNLNAPRQFSIRYFPNHGCDVRPFWQIGLELASQYTVFLKLHTKSSPQYESRVGLEWLDDILQNLLVDSTTVLQIADLIHKGKYGAVFPLPWKPFRYWGWTHKENLYSSQDICSALCLDPSILLAPLLYPVGNMYWGSTSLFRHYGEQILGISSWPEEPVPNDGTLLHALERMTGYLYLAENKEIAYAACSHLKPQEHGLFTWHVKNIVVNNHAYSCPAIKEGYTYLDDGQLSPASLLACLVNGINSCMVAKPSMFPRSQVLTVVEKRFSFSRILKQAVMVMTRGRIGGPSA